MSSVVSLNEIKSLLQSIDLIPLIEAGFVAYSNGQSVVPPVGELKLDKGEVHIKYGFITAQEFYVIKIASGFYGNTDLGLSTSGGCMLVFSQQTGQLKAALLDEGHLTDVRTAVAGAIAAKHFAPSKVSKIGIVGTGIQARAQLNHLRNVVSCRDVLVWGRSTSGLKSFAEFFGDATDEKDDKQFRIVATQDIVDVQKQCNLIVTTTPSTKPLLSVEHLCPGTHITAVGSDMPDKQELDSAILTNADLVVADSIQQCKVRGEISQAIRQRQITSNDVIELGNVISGKAKRRLNDEQISVVDLTGVAVQDIQIATAVFDAHDGSSKGLM